MMKINVGVIGYGLSGRYLQAPFFEIHKGFNLHSIVTKSNNPKIDFPNVQHVLEVDDLLNNSEIDLVSICSPNPTHYTLAKRCLNHGKHILVEKPLVATLKEAMELYDLAESKGQHIFVYQNRRFDSDFLAVEKLIKSKVLGEIVSLEINYYRYKPELHQKKWKETYDPSNGIMYDLGSHIIDQSIVLFGKPERWYGQTFTQRIGSDIDDAFMVWLDYGEKKVLLRSGLLVAIDQPRYIITGTLGMAVKYGIDVQEDHLKEGISTDDANFGIEDSKNSIRYVKNYQEMSMKAEKGRWMSLYDNIFNVLMGNSLPVITKEQILTQIEILEYVRKNS